MKKSVALLTMGKKTTMNEYENNDSDILWALYIVYKKLGQFFLYTYSLTWLNKDTPVLLKVTNIWTSSSIKYKNNGLNFLKNTL